MGQKLANDLLQCLNSTVNSNRSFFQSDFLLFMSSTLFLLHFLLLLLVSTEESCFSGKVPAYSTICYMKKMELPFFCSYSHARTCTHRLAHTKLQRWFLTNVWKSSGI